MKSFIAALRNLVLPWGATSGRRIVLDGDNAEIGVYGADNNLDILISSLQEAIQLFLGTDLAISLDATDGTIRLYSGGSEVIRLDAPNGEINVYSGGNLAIQIDAADGSLTSYGSPGDTAEVDGAEVTATADNGSVAQLSAGGAFGAGAFFLPSDDPPYAWGQGAILADWTVGSAPDDIPFVGIYSPYETSNPDGSAGVSAITLYGQDESGAGTSIDILTDEITANGVFSVYGNDQFTTYTPSVTGGGAVTWTTRTGWWQRIGKMVYFTAYLVVNGAGSGATAVSFTAPSSIDRTTRQTVTVNLDGAYSAGLFGTGTAVATTGGSGATWDRIRASNNGANNADGNLTGADLLAGAVITVQGWYREA